MKKTLSAIKSIIVTLITVLAVFMMVFTIISVTTFNRNDRALLGYRLYIVNSDSMSSSGIEAGDLILVKQVEPSTLKEGDIITYISQNTESFGQNVTHMIREIVTDAQGNPGFVTYGTTTGTNDETVVTYPYVMGQFQKAIPNVGTFFHFLKTPQGYFTCIFIPFMLLILYQGINTIQLFRRYKKEQMEEVTAEKEKLEAERLANAKMMEELKALKEQLERGQSAAAADSSEKAASNEEVDSK